VKPGAAASRQRLLMRWHGVNRRPLPWRRPAGERPPAYVVLVSESMLQQTRVETVLDYFERWMARWPTLADLAAAPLDDVLAQWSGLGYYNRARNLHAAARQIVALHNGQLPTDVRSLAALPGVGPYTLGALRSIALGQPAPLVDGNVGRVLSRWFELEAPAASASGRKEQWRLAGELLEEGPAHAAPGLWNESLMELGALICRPRRPDCGACPVVDTCQAHASGRQDELPRPAIRRPPTPVSAAALVALCRDDEDRLHVLLGQRPARGRWPRLWQPPMFEGADAQQILARRLASNGITARGSLPPVVHVLTHRRYEVHTAWTWVDDLALGAALAGTEHIAWRWQPLAQATQRGQGLSRLAVRLLEQAAAAPAISGQRGDR